MSIGRDIENLGRENLKDYDGSRGTYLMTLEGLKERTGIEKYFDENEPFLLNDGPLTLPGGIIGGMQNTPKQVLPHYSELVNLARTNTKAATDKYLAGGKVNMFTDNAGNIIIFGFYECTDDDNYAGYDCKKPQPLKSLLDSGIAFRGFQKSFFEPNKVLSQGGPGWSAFDRNVGGGFLESSLSGILFGAGNWEKRLQDREKMGKADHPWIYTINDVTPFTWSTLEYHIPAFNYIIGGLIVALGAGLVALGIPGTPLVMQGANMVISEANGSGNQVSSRTVLKAGSSILKGILGGSAGLNGYRTRKGLNDDLLGYLDKGLDIWDKAERNDYGGIVSSLGATDAGAALQAIESGDASALAKLSNLNIKEADSVSTAYNYADSVKKMVNDGEIYYKQAISAGNAMLIDPIKNIIKTASNMPELSLVMPGMLQSITALINTTKITDFEFIDLIKSFSGEGHGEVLKRVTVDSLVNDSKNYIHKKFVIPAAIPDEIAYSAFNRINREVRGVNVVMPGRSYFYPAFS